MKNIYFNRYGTVISFVSSFFTDVTDTDETYKMLNQLNNEVNELETVYLVGQDEEVGDVIENASLVYNNQLKLFDDHILNDKHRTPKKRISSQKLSKPATVVVIF